MTFPEPKFSRTQVQKAGDYLISEDAESDFSQWFDAFIVLSNWRACHGYPINTFQATLRTKLKRLMGMHWLHKG